MPKDPSRPPVVFHYVPIIGCAVSYGMDPYKFLFDARDKVRFFSRALSSASIALQLDRETLARMLTRLVR